MNKQRYVFFCSILIHSSRQIKMSSNLWGFIGILVMQDLLWSLLSCSSIYLLSLIFVPNVLDAPLLSFSQMSFMCNYCSRSLFNDCRLLYYLPYHKPEHMLWNLAWRTCPGTTLLDEWTFHLNFYASDVKILLAFVWMASFCNGKKMKPRSQKSYSTLINGINRSFIILLWKLYDEHEIHLVHSEHSHHCTCL